MNRTPIRKQRIGPPRSGLVLDSDFRKWLRKQPCIVCGRTRYVEAAHVGPRGLSQKCSDREELPLCDLHHWRGPLCHHVLQRKFWIYWKLDRWALIAWFNERYDREVKGAGR